MTEKLFKGCVQHRHDIEANWNESEYIPIKGELVIYDIEVDDEGNILSLPSGRTAPYLYERFKIGDGKTTIKDLHFQGQTTVQIITWESGD